MGIMRERAESVGAVLEIDSQPGCGTRIKVTWPGTRGEAA
jgi:signal transduction histidine kinase